MIQIESIKILELRGIRELKLEMNRGSFVISGPNGSGKTLCANISETSRSSTITVGRGKKSHFDEHKQDKQFFRSVGSFGA